MLKKSPFTIAVKETNYNITLITVGCLTWDEVNTRWDPNKCDVRLIWLYIEIMSQHNNSRLFLQHHYLIIKIHGSIWNMLFTIC